MVDFTRAQVGSNVSSPYAQGAAPSGPSAVATLAETVGAFIPSKRDLDEIAKRRQKETAASVTEMYSQEALRLADAVDTGQMSSNAARSRMRRLYSQYIADNPGLQKELYDVHSRILSTSGLGQVIDEGTEQEQLEAAYRKKVAEAGFITAGMNEEEQAAAVEQYRSFEISKYMLEIQAKQLEFANSELENISKRIGIQRGQIGLEKDRLSLQRTRIGLQNDQIETQTKLIGLQQKQASYMADLMIGQMSQTFTPTFQRNVNEIITGLGEAPTPEQRMLAQEKINNLWAETYGAVIQGMGPGASTENVNLTLAPIKFWMDKAIEVVKGERELSSLQTQSDILIQRQALGLLGDPEVKAAAALTSIMGENIALSTVFTEAGVRAFKRSLEGNPPTPSSPEYPEFAALSMAVLEAAANDQLESSQSVEEARINLNNLLAGIGSVYNPSAQDLDVAAEQLSSLQFGAYVDKFGLAGFDREALQGALSTFDEYYVQQVVPLIRERWQQATFRDLSNPNKSVPSAFRPATHKRDVSSSFKVSFSGSGVKFIPTGPTGRTTGTQYDATHMGRAEARRLNEEVAPVLNKLIRLGSHLEGHTDYRTFFEKNYRELFETDVMREEEGEGTEG